MSRVRRSIAIIGGGAGALVLIGCAAGEADQSMLNPGGRQADAIYGLWLWMLGIGAAVWLVVVAVMLVAIVRRRRHEDTDATSSDAPARETATRGSTVRTVVVAGAVVPAVIIAVVLTMSTSVQREIDGTDVADARAVEVVGHQFWWEVRYPGEGIVAANEVHIPVGEPVRIDVSAQDVIHSFWVPELGGKIDMVPGQSNSTWLEASEPGTYWGQCAEYCGQQHARMRLVVVAHEESEYEGWVQAQLATPQQQADESDDEMIARGRDVFLSSSCVYCHTVDGTAAAGEVGPDLTHMASRQTLAAGTLPNDRASLSAWLLDPQSIKPGNLMPATAFDDPNDFDALLAYLESLE